MPSSYTAQLAPSWPCWSPSLLAQTLPVGLYAPTEDNLSPASLWLSCPRTKLRPGGLSAPPAQAQCGPSTSPLTAYSEHEPERGAVQLERTLPAAEKLPRQAPGCGEGSSRATEPPLPALPPPQGIAGPGTGEWPHLQAMRFWRSEPPVRLFGGASGKAVGASARETPNEFSVAPRRASGGDRQGQHGQGQGSGYLPRPGTPPPHPGVPNTPCQPPPRGAEEGAWPMQCQDPSAPPLGIQNPEHSLPTVPRDPLLSQRFPDPCPSSVLSPTPSSHSLVSRAGKEGDCCWLLTALRAGRGWADARRGLSSFLGCSESSRKGHEAAELHSHSCGLPRAACSAWGGFAPMNLVKHLV